jgi:hypothetical protein
MRHQEPRLHLGARPAPAASCVKIEKSLKASESGERMTPRTLWATGLPRGQ